MEEQFKLPIVNESGCYEIRLESLGGLGANLCGKMLGELGAVGLGLNASSFSSYGSEKRGSPVKANIRWCAPNQEIRLNSPVENPHILGAFSERFSIAGITRQTKAVINTKEEPQQVRDRLKLPAEEVYCVNAQKIAMDTKSRVNMVMLGAIVKASGFIPLEEAERLTEETVGKKYPKMLDQNLNGLRQGYEQTVFQSFEEDTQYSELPYAEPKSDWGYSNAPIGGANTRYGSTITNELSETRQGYVPLFIKERCINCGLCDSTCPDMVFQFLPGEYKGKEAMVNFGLDYHHCKGCLRCVSVCPTEALVRGVEREQEHLVGFMRNKDLIVKELDYEQAGASSWITSESYLTEQRVDGGLV